jgi:hypothetical protein
MIIGVIFDEFQGRRCQLLNDDIVGIMTLVVMRIVGKVVFHKRFVFLLKFQGLLLDLPDKFSLLNHSWSFEVEFHARVSFFQGAPELLHKEKTSGRRPLFVLHPLPGLTTLLNGYTSISMESRFS